MGECVRVCASVCECVCVFVGGDLLVEQQNDLCQPGVHCVPNLLVHALYTCLAPCKNNPQDVSAPCMATIVAHVIYIRWYHHIRWYHYLTMVSSYAMVSYTSTMGKSQRTADPPLQPADLLG